MRVAYITKQMNLSEQDAQVFWPILNKYDAKMKDLRGDERPRKIDTTELSDAEAKALYNKRLDMAEQKVALTRQLVGELEQKMPSTQILAYLKAEDSFKKEVLSRVKQRMEGRRHEER